MILYPKNTRIGHPKATRMLALAIPQAAAPIALPLAITIVLATVVLLSIALDLRRLRRISGVKAIHGVIGAVSAAVVLGGALTMSLALGSVPAATADPSEGVPPAPITNPDITDIQLPTLGVE